MIKDSKLRILHMTAMYPSTQYPSLGQFVKSQIDSLYQYVQIDLFIVQGLQGFLPYLLAVPRMLNALYFGTHDIVHIHYGTLASIVKLLYWGKRPIITSYCGDDLQGTIGPSGSFTFKSKVLMRINRVLAVRDDHSIAKSELLALKLNYSRKVSIVPNGVNLIKFTQLDRVVSRRRLGIAPSARVLLFPADPNLPVKNYRLLSEGLEMAFLTDVVVLTFDKNGVRVEDTPFYFNSADLVVFTSLSEGSPNVIKEAMACNCRIFSTPCGDVPWLLENVEGSRVIGYDTQDWAESLRYFFEYSSESISLSRRAIVDKGIDLDSTARRIMDIYSSVFTR